MRVSSRALRHEIERDVPGHAGNRERAERAHAGGALLHRLHAEGNVRELVDLERLVHVLVDAVLRRLEARRGNGNLERLQQRGLAYQAGSGDVNLAVRKFPGYGKLSGKSLDELQAGVPWGSANLSRSRARRLLYESR